MPEATPTESAQVTDLQRYQFLRDVIRPAHLQYLRTHCESQSEFDNAIVSLMRQHAESWERLSGKRAA